MNVRSIRRPERAPRLTEGAIDKIRERIVSGAWGPGDRLPKESELAAELRVLEVRQGYGTYVSSLEPDLLLESTHFISHLLLGDTEIELYEVRRILEAAAAALAAGRIDVQEKVELAQILERMGEAKNVEELVESDVAFHAVVARAAGNAVLTSLLASLATRTMRARLWHGREADGALDETRDEHRRIYEAIMAGDPDLARAAAASHIASSERWLKGRLAMGRSA